MLVIQRKPTEGIVLRIGCDTVILTVVDVQGERVRLGFEAPKDIVIDRREVHEWKQRNQPERTT